MKKLPPARCLYTIGLGYDAAAMCVTPRQHARFFQGLCRVKLTGPRQLPLCPPPRIGRGGSASVYPTREPGKALKLTISRTDVAASLAARGLPGVVKLHDVFEAGSDGVDPIWGLLVETLVPNNSLPPQHPAFVRDGANVVTCVDHYLHDIREKRRRGRPMRAHATIIANGVQLCARRGTIVRPRAARMVRDTLDAWAQLDQRGIGWSDAHIGNIGWSAADRRWKILDLGFAGVAPKPRVPVFRGGR